MDLEGRDGVGTALLPDPLALSPATFQCPVTSGCQEAGSRAPTGVVFRVCGLADTAQLRHDAVAS